MHDWIVLCGLVIVVSIITINWHNVHADFQVGVPAKQKIQESVGVGAGVEWNSEMQKKFRQAIELYYQDSYRLALPLFEEVAGSFDTIDVRYWLGRSAYRSGDVELAIKNFVKILERDPDRHAVRLDLVLAYLYVDKIDLAKWELQKVVDRKPPPELRKTLNTAIMAVRQKEQRVFISFRASAGVKYDSNINGSSNLGDLLLADGDTLTGLQRRRGGGHVTKANIDVLWDLGQPGGFFWRNQLNLYQEKYASYHEFDFDSIDYRTSFESHADEKRIRLPFGMRLKQFAGRDLAKSTYFEPNFEYNLSQTLDLTFTYRTETEKFAKESDEAQDNITNTFTFGPRKRLESNGKSHMLFLKMRYADRDANSDYDTGFDRFSYEEWSFAPSYFMVLDKRNELFLQAGYADRDYDGSPIGFSRRRRDGRYSLIGVLSRAMNGYFMTLSAMYTENHSNIPLYDFQKFSIGMDVGVALNY